MIASRIIHGVTDVRSGSIAPHRPSTGHDRSTPITGHQQTDPVGLFRANKRHGGRVHFSFDDLVGATNERGWDSEPERLGGLQVDRKLDLRDLLHRQIGRLLAL